MLPLSLSWGFGAVVVLCWSSVWPQVRSALSPENEVPLRPTTWLPEGKITHVKLPKGRTVRLYFILKKKTPGMSVTVSPCNLPIEWSLAARTLKDNPLKSLQWSTKKSTPEVWWRGPGTEEKIHSFSGNSVDTYTGHNSPHASIYIVRLRSKQQSSKATVYLHDGVGPSGAFPLLPKDTHVHTLGVGMTSVTLNWSPSPSLTTKKGYEYCVLVNSKSNYPSVCAAQESIRRKVEDIQNRNEKKRRMTPWPILKEWWWEQWDSYPDPQNTDEAEELQCVCKGAENVCTVSELLPDTQYYFDVFVMDKLNETSVAYTGTYARTHEEARPDIITLREGELRWVNFPERSFNSEQFFSFRPRGWQQSGLLTLQSCGKDDKVKVTVSSKGQVLESQKVGGDLVQIWLQGSPSYLIHLEREGTPTKTTLVALPAGLTASVKMQTSSAYHKRGIPSLPSTLQIKSFNKLRTCNSVTIAWMGTEERSLYCVYRRKLDGQEAESGKALALNAPCLGPESRSDTERVLCKYFQELNPRRAVTTAVISGLEPGMAYVFDVYLMRRWGIPIKYTSKMVKTRRDC
ncbi:protein NDNF [Boleophthalmus pectinirostris]|uniref:protein NDNF n=1 Tax=Boleophthalmus pectinirostris TaxID=150288 RepID=UPI0024314A5B|nr:protein NDNF [Boleophthalmus pectinirostris]